MIRKIICTLSLITLLTSCVYRLPEEGEVSLIPATNNPSVTGESSTWTPGVPM